MSSTRFDELFSPERLRANWVMLTRPVQETPQLLRNQDIHNHYQKLRCLINESFSDTTRLSIFFTELTDIIAETFPLDAVNVADDNQKQILIEKLEELDELLWVLSLSKGK